jgi:hypothetical protein
VKIAWKILFIMSMAGAVFGLVELARNRSKDEQKELSQAVPLTKVVETTDQWTMASTFEKFGDSGSLVVAQAHYEKMSTGFNGLVFMSTKDCPDGMQVWPQVGTKVKVSFVDVRTNGVSTIVTPTANSVMLYLKPDCLP